MLQVIRNIDHLCPLRPLGPKFQTEINTLLEDRWLAKKVDRTRRLREHTDFLNNYLPELFRRKGKFVDIGPGPGESMEIARALGSVAIGYDAPTIEGGMGKSYLEYSKLMHFRQMLNVKYVTRDVILRDVRDVDFVVMRGSVEQVFHDCMTGPPHHLHQKASELEWNIEKSRIELPRFLQQISESLAPGGVVVIHANGSQNNAAYCEQLERAAAQSQLKVQRVHQLLHRLTT
jgi:SAM-dependent methyltransferase